jgi:hypothetical protein
MRQGFKVTPTLKNKINSLAEIVGVKLNWQRKCGIQYNKKDIACKNQDASNIIHDIAHFAVATKKNRQRLDFGLGAGPDSLQEIENSFADIRCYSENPDRIEEYASALGIHWEKELKLPWKNTMIYHGWHPQELQKKWKTKFVSKFLSKYKIYGNNSKT